MNQIDGFLRTEGVHPADIDFEQTVELFLREMEAGLAGEPSSLQMIPSYIGERFDPRPGECVAAVDAGGTNLRVSKVRFGEDRRCTVESMEKLPMPGSRGPVEAAEFFDQLAQHLGGRVAQHRHVARWAAFLDVGLVGGVLVVDRQFDRRALRRGRLAGRRGSRR